jgi:hypothetical protein
MVAISGTRVTAEWGLVMSTVRRINTSVVVQLDHGNADQM